MNIYLNWWIGGLALAGLTIVFRLLTGRTLGVSGSWRKIVFWKQERENDANAAALIQNQSKTANALLAATLAEFGEVDVASPSSNNTATSSTTSSPSVVPWTAHFLFLLCMFLGGMIWAFYTGHLHFQFALSKFHTQISGNPWVLSLELLIGGFMVGFGTQMAGGCSSGHGLSGCANFSWASMMATAVFFCTAIIVSLLIKAFIL